MTDLVNTEAIRGDFAECQAYTRHYAKTFYFASHVLPEEKRMAAYALYAFCRYADEIVDNTGAVVNITPALRELRSLRDRLAAVYSRADMRVPKLMAFQATVRKYNIPEEYFLDLIRGVEMDLLKKRYLNFAELDEYCYCVASTVGLIITSVFGAKNEERALEHAMELGKAMQLTNILRDIGEDFHRGRLYLPADEIGRFGVREQDLRSGSITPEFVELMKFQIRRARALYRSADAGIPDLTNDGSRFCVKLMSRTYEEILDAIEANQYDTLSRRAHVPLTKKFRIAARAFLEKDIPGEHANVHLLRPTIPPVVRHRPKESTNVL